MIRHDTRGARLGLENLEMRECPTGLDATSFSWGEFSWGEFSWGASRIGQSNPNEAGTTSIPVEQMTPTGTRA